MFADFNSPVVFQIHRYSLHMRGSGVYYTVVTMQLHITFTSYSPGDKPPSSLICILILFPRFNWPLIMHGFII